MRQSSATWLMPKSEALPPDVRPMLDGPYWRIVIRPSRYVPGRIPYDKLRDVLDKTQVRLRGWYFPHLTNQQNEIQHGPDFYGTWVVFTNYEYWRFYQSAQLVHYHGVREYVDESYRARTEEVTKGNLKWLKPDWSQVHGCIDIINFLYTVTEAFEFAGRLALLLQLDGSMEISITLRNIERFILGVSDHGRGWDFIYQCSQSDLAQGWDVDTKELKVDSAPFSLAAVKWFFERFGWTNVNMNALEDAQSALLKRRLRS